MIEEKDKKKVKLCILLGIILAFLLAIWVLLEQYEVTTVYVEGNRHYTASEIRSMVVSGWFGDNSLVLYWKYRNRSITDVPFIETMEVRVVDQHTIRIVVYEKALAGYVQYLDRYMYFDKDGILVENSEMPTAGIPLVSGLRFDHFVMYEPLEVPDSDVFQNVLNVTQMLQKYDLALDRIYFDEKSEMTLYFGSIRVFLGSNELIEEKIQHLDAILQREELVGKSGLLDMSRYKNGTESSTFIED